MPKIFKYLAMERESFLSNRQNIVLLLTGYLHLFGTQLLLQCKYISICYIYIFTSDYHLFSDSVMDSLKQYNLDQQDALVEKINSFFLSKGKKVFYTLHIAEKYL